jgi:hypothetical protein
VNRASCCELMLQEVREELGGRRGPHIRFTNPVQPDGLPQKVP